MPVCKYEVLAGGPEGPPVFYATIGQMFYFKWTCTTETQGVFCMTVHTCIVDDGNGDKVELIDNKGYTANHSYQPLIASQVSGCRCARDKYLLQNLDYVGDLLVGKEAHVYKYADRPNMYFDCQITLTIKEPGQQYCDVPQCPDPPRRRRGDLSAANEAGPTNETAITTGSEPELVIDSNGNASFLITREMMERDKSENGWIGGHFKAVGEDELCMTGFGATMIGGINVAMLMAAGLLARNAYKAVRDTQ